MNQIPYDIETQNSADYSEYYFSLEDIDFSDYEEVEHDLLEDK